MTKTTPTALLRQWQLGESTKSLCLNRNGHWIAAAMVGGYVALAFSEDAGEEPQLVKIDESEIVSLIPDCDEHAFLVLTESGKVFITEPQIQAPTQLAQKENISCIASSSAGHRAFSVGETIYFLDELGQEKKETLIAPSVINDLKFNDDDSCLAASHEQGITVFVLAGGGRELSSDVMCHKLMWQEDNIIALRGDKGVAVWSSDSEAPIILSDQNYQNAPCLCGMTTRAQFLAVSGARQAVLFPSPFSENVPPLMLGGADRRVVTVVAPHPCESFVMIGYDDGMVVMAPLDGRVPIMIHPPTAPMGAAVTGLVWNPRGDSLSVTLESGWLMLFTEKSIQKAIRARLK